MSSEFHQEIFRQELPAFRSIYLRVSPNGAVRIDAQDMGKTVEEIWGDSDYEFWVDVPEVEIQKLLFALLKEKYAGRPGAVDEFKDFCQANGIENKWDSWA
jgi:hypothetical protein